MEGNNHYSAWQLAGDWWWVEQGLKARIVGGRSIYETASASRTFRSVVLRVAKEVRPGVMRTVPVYVHPDTQMELIEEQQHERDR